MKEYRAHPAVGLKPSSWRPFNIGFGAGLPPFAWLRLSEREQAERRRRFNKAILRFFSGSAAVLVHASFLDEDEASAFARASGLARDGMTVVGEASGDVLPRVEDLRWSELTLVRDGQIVMRDCGGHRGIFLVLSDDEATTLGHEIAPQPPPSSSPSGQRTRNAVLYVAARTALFLVVVFAFTLMWNRLDDAIGLVASGLLTLACLALFLRFFPSHIVGGALRRRVYGPLV